MRSTVIGYAIAALICAPIQQLLLDVTPIVSIGSCIMAAILFAAVHIAWRYRLQLIEERREAVAVQKKLSASLFALYLNGALEDEQLSSAAP